MGDAATQQVPLDQVRELAERALGAWPLERPVARLLERKKNVTFKVDAAGGPRYVLRVCDPDSYGEAEIRSELLYLLALGAATGLLVPEPVRARDGALVVRGEAAGLERPRWCALFRWVPGRMVADAPTPQRLEQVGEIAGRLHRFSQEWLPPEGFARPRWDAAGLFGSGPVLAPGQGAPVVTERSRDLLDEAAGVVRAAMAGLGEGRDVFGLIHKDLEPDNTLVDGERVHAIDFADFGWGYYLYDIAAALLPLREKPGFAAMREAFLRGYRRIRPLAAEHAELLDTFFIARGIFSARLMTGRLWDMPKIREYAESAVPQILGGIRIFLERRRGRMGAAAARDSTRTTAQVLSLLRSRGVKLWAAGDKLRYSAPPGALTPELLAELKERKEELLGFLRQGQSARRSGAPSRIKAAGCERPPLSFAQQRLWLVHQLAPESAEYNIARAVRLRGRVRVDLLAASLREIVRRHAALRTTFAVEDGQPVQVVAPELAPALPLVDLAALPAERREAEAWRLAQEDARRPFDLSRGPLLRVFLLRLDGKDFIAPSTLHHIVGDGWSSGILFREMGLVYGALARGVPPALPPLPVQYVDFAVWQRQWLSGEVLEEQLAWWKQQLAGAPQELALPTDRPRSALRSARGDRRPLLVPRSLAEALRAFSQAQGATLFMILLAAWKTLLCRLCGQDDLVIGSPIANRNRTEIEGLIGCFVNTLVLRTVFSGDPTFREVLAAVRRTTLGAYAHQDLPFEKLVEELRPERSLTQTPLFQVIFTLQNVPSPDMEVADFRMTLMPPTSREAMFDLTCNMKEMPEGVRTSLMYREDLFDGATVVRLAERYLRLLAAAAADPDQRIRELPLLSAAESQQILEWGGAREEHRSGDTLAALFEARVRQAPEARAVTCEGEDLTYGELNARANRLARRLRQLGAGPEARVGLCVERSLDLVIGILGIVKAGGAYLPLDPSYPPERLALLVEDAGARVLVGTGQTLERLPPGGIAVRLDGADEVERLAETDPPPLTEAENAAYVIYTSGSTGRPKGVMVTHSNVIRLLRATQPWFGFSSADVWTLFHSYAFDFSVWEIWGALLHGGRLVVVPWEVSRKPEAFHDLLAGERVTVLNQTPTAFAELMRVDEEPARAGALAGLRLVIFGGEALVPARLAPWLARYGDAGPRLVNMYGITETTVHVTYRPLSVVDGGQSSVIGTPIPDLSVHVLDRGGQLAPIGVPGELVIGGAGLARGYFGRSDLTADRFVPAPFSQPGARLYRSGDLGRFLPTGDLEYLGRIDHQVKIRGFRIEPGEIEAALLRQPEIREAVVLVRQDRPGDARLVACVVPHSKAKLQSPPSDLRVRLGEVLPSYMVPASFVWLDALPLTANGKVDRKALLALEEVPRTNGGFVAPRTAVEELVAGIFAEVLKLDGVGREANFFELGGHSLLATQVVSRVRQALGVELPLRSLFASPAVSDLAREVEELRRAGAGPALPPVTREPRGARIPLSFAQERLWFLYRFAPEGDAYNVSLALHLEGGLRREVAARALGEIVRRHEVLRTVIAEVAGEPAQVILPAAGVALPLCDLSGLPPARREAEARRIAAAEASRPFDLASGPMLRVQLMRLDERRHVGALTFHHVVTDGWSMGILVREFCALYRAFALGEPPPLTELPVQYADYAVWQRRWLAGPALERQLAHWRQRLGVDPPPLELPFDRPRSPDRVWGGEARRFVLAPALTDRLNRFSRERSASLFMTLLATWQALLGRLSGQQVIRVGTPVANRRQVEIEELIGCFVNTLVLATDVAGRSPSFATLVERVRETSLEAQAHQDAPFDRVVEELVSERDLSRSPLVQVLFVLQNAPGASADLPDLRLTHLAGEARSAQFDLSLQVEEGSGGLAAQLDYSTDLFDAPTAERLVRHLQTLLAAAVAAPDRRIVDLPLLSPAEAQQLLREWNDTAAPPADSCLHELIAAQARRTPHRVAVLFEGRSLTYRDLDAAAERLARRIAGLGVGPDVPVGLFAERSLEMMVALLAILKAGGAYLPLDPDYPSDRLAFMIQDSGVPVLLAQDHLLGGLPASGATVVSLARVADPAREDPPTLSVAVGPANLAYVIYTSGSTGRPKGVMIPHRAIVNRLRWMCSRFPFTESDLVLQKTTFSFDASVWELFQPLVSGVGLLLARPGGHRDPSYLADVVGREGVTVLQLVPSMLGPFLDEPGLVRCSHLRLVFAGGEALPSVLAERFSARLGGASLCNLYGPTETAIDATFRPCNERREGPAVPIGRPIQNARAYVLDRELRPVPAGVVGELYVGGRGLGRGYLGRAALTAEAFVPDPFGDLRGEPGARLYKTGDLARVRAEGEIDFLGRVDHQVKVRGFRIELREVESVLRSLPGVKDAVVLARQEPEGGNVLIAYVAGADGEGDLRSALRQRLPDFMVPSLFVKLEALPLTPNGKVDRKALPAPEACRRAPEETVVPRTPVEEVLAGIWADLLGFPSVGIHDSFFDLGGHSLLATRVIARIRQALGVELPLRALFEGPTVADLAARLASSLEPGDVPPPLRPVPRGAELPLSFAQERLWFLDQLAPGGVAYNSPGAIRLRGPLEAGVLARTLREIVRRHEVLRTSYPAVDGRPVQRISPSVDLPLPVVDLSALASGEREEEVQRRIAAEARRPFDLARGPVLRAVLLRLAAAEHAAVVTLHHIACDGWSNSVLLREVAALYHAFREGRPSPLPELPVQYADFAHWQRLWLRGEVLEERLAWWRRLLGGNPEPLRLPTDRPRPVRSSERGVWRSFRLSPDLSRSLVALSQREGVTLFMCLLAAFDVLLLRITGQEDVVVGTAVANRGRIETEGLIGFFIEMLPTRVDLSGNPRFKELLRRVRDVSLGVFANQDCPIERLMDEMRPEVGGEVSPLLRVAFGVRNTPVGELHIPGLEISPITIEHETVRFDVTVWVTESTKGLEITWTFRSELFEAATIERLNRHYETLLRSVVADPEARIGGLEMRSAEERQWRAHEDQAWREAQAGKLSARRRKAVGGLT